EDIRKMIGKKYPQLHFNFEPLELTEKIMGQGALTPIEVKVGSGQIKIAANHAKKIEKELKEIPYLRDVRIAESLNSPTLQIDINRDLAAQFGLTMQDVSKALVAATSSTPFTDKN